MGNSCKGTTNRPSNGYRENQKQPANFTLQDLPALSTYPVENVYAQQVQGAFVDQTAFRLYGSYMSRLKQANKQFVDENFKLNGEKVHLSRLYTKKTPPKMFSSSGSQTLQQANKQFTYLSAVFCYIANNPTLLKKLMLTQPNEQALYVSRLFPNGDYLMVVVDDQVPYHKQRILYSRPLQFQLWMYVTQKSWSKLIGGYDAACGLSPQDAFQEIIGAPAYSYSFIDRDAKSSQLLQTLIHNKKKENMCIILTARKQDYVTINSLSRQVFYLEGFENCAGLDFVKLRCPFTDFNFRGDLHEKAKTIDELDKLVGYSDSHPGTIYLSPNQVFNLFEYCTIGFHKEGYETTSHAFTSNFNEAVYFAVTVRRKQPINLRIIQYYQGYIRNNHNYDYSPVYIQMFNADTRKLMHEGCRRAIYRYVNQDVFEQIFEELNPGQYFLKINIQWLFPQKIHEARLVSYSQSPIQISRVHKQQGNKQYDELIRGVITRQDIKSIQDLQYGSKWLRNSVYLFYNNLSAKELRLIVNLKQSSNLVPVIGDFLDKYIEVNLQPRQSRLIQLRKDNVNKEGSLGQYMIQMV